MTTKSVATFVFCPRCGVPGQLVEFRPNTSAIDFIVKTKGHHVRPPYFAVNHFKDRKGRLKKRIGSHFHARYAYTCYLGKIVVLDGIYDFFFPEKTAFAIAQRIIHFL